MTDQVGVQSILAISSVVFETEGSEFARLKL